MSGLILYGDSVFFGYGASDKNKGCGRLLKGRLNTPILIKAKNNITSKDAVANASSLFSGHPTYNKIAFLFGNNDCRLQSQDTPVISKSEFESNLTALISLSKKRRKVCYLCNLQPIDNSKFMLSGAEMIGYMKTITDAYAWHKSYSDICEEMAEKNNISLINIRKALEDGNKDVFYIDGLHPNDIGHEIIAQELYQALTT